MIAIRTDSGEEQLSLAEFEARVRSGRIVANTQVSFPILTGDRFVDAKEIELFRHLYQPARIYFARRFSLRGFPVVTTLFVILQVLLYFGLAGARQAVDLDPLIFSGAKVRSNILELGETWRLITANLLHHDRLHLFFNMFFLLNVGGTVEAAYRRQDYVLLLVVSGLSTTVISTWFGSLPSVGASGMVLGLFGAVSVFGYKYADVLPRRYKNYFLFAVLPYALFVLYVGLFTADTDNWGHLGGLLGGSFVAVALEPKLMHLARAEKGYFRAHWPALVSVSLVAAVLVAGPVIRGLEPRLTALSDGDSGLYIAYPPGWRFGENHLGYPAWGNTLGVSFGVRARRHAERPVSLPALRRLFFEEELAGPERAGEITQLQLVAERPVAVEGGEGLELEIALESRAGRHQSINLLIARGYYSYFVVASVPVAWAESYRPLVETLLRRARLIETNRLLRSRELVRAFPGMSSARVELAGELAQLGEVEAARRAYHEALDTLPEHPDALYGLARLIRDYGGDLEEAEGIAARLRERRPESAEVAVLLADLRARLGQLDRARAVLEEALERAPDSAELREQLSRLR